MSSRSYFENRETIPGLLFIIIIILCIIPELYYPTKFINLMNFDLSTGIIISILTFFGSTTITYIINQFWYNSFNEMFMNKFFGKFEERDIYKFLMDLNIQNNEKYLKTVANYFASTHEKELSDYIDRRWDLYNLLGSMVSACILGSVIGYIIKLCVCDFNRNMIFYNIFFIIVLLGFILLLIKGMRKNWKDNVEMNIFGIRKRLQSKPISYIIPPEYFNE